MSDVPTPSQQIVAAAASLLAVTDALGRKLTVRRMRVSDRLRFVKIVPGGLQNNPLWMANALAIASVVDVNGVPVMPIQSEQDIERVGDMLGDEGLNAANEALTILLRPATTPKEALAAAGE